MRTVRRVLSGSVTALVLAVSLPAVAAAAAGPHIVTLGTLGGSCCSEAMAINDDGVVTGYAMIDVARNTHHAFRWKGGVMTDLGTLGGDRSFATAINDNGWIVGYSELTPGDLVTHAFLWRPGIGMTDLGLPGSASLATGISDSGVIVGHYLLDGDFHGFRWAAGVTTTITGPDGARFMPAGINKYGKLGGTLGTTPPGDPATWKNGQVVASGLIGNATAINDNGDVSGTYGDSRQGAFVWRADGTVLHLSMPAGGEQALTTGINESRHTVGSRSAVDGSTRAVYWSEFGTPRLLPGLWAGGWSGAQDVNRLGQTVGMAYRTGSAYDYVAVMWTR
ncbi:hypothetical protein Cme02nite_29260 [Catellatospora methionotrophica]|uniref:Uncharacterized protein n=1 Tax=Catellatospora methionotrophica TaxID=121620 RepID=A0A8J3LA75_9ACTN|nr:hypothetical protein [Catellatospora methionotrophica]GIG14594.1 hypothetical protein Cme02nite_29260 [Catellatospora methionotrophica]